MGKETISAALGLTEEWLEKNQKNVAESVEKHDTISDVVLDQVLQLKNDEFGLSETRVTEVSQYERKLVFMGLTIAKHVMQSKMPPPQMLGMMAMMELMKELKDAEGKGRKKEDDNDNG